MPTDPQPLPLTYRQVVPLNAGHWNSADFVELVEGSGDGVIDATSNLYAPWDPEIDPGTIDDPLVPFTTTSCDSSYCHALALDITVDGLPGNAPDNPQFSMFYGFADTTTQAASLLDTAGATTHAIAQATNWDEGSVALLVGFHRPA